MIKGQEKICTFIDNCTLDNFPRTLLLVGDKGSGKHLICDYISKKFQLITIDISDRLSQDIIEEINLRVEPTLYIIDGNKLTIKSQNVILKFLEEPLKNSFIVIPIENTTSLLDTVLNRCQLLTLANYSREQLKEYTQNDLILEIANTPGQVKDLNCEDVQSMLELASKIIDKIAIANIPNTLTLTNKFAFKDEKGKIPLKLFIRFLCNLILKRFTETNDVKLLNAYQITSQLQKDLTIPNVDQKYLFDKYLVELRSTMKGSLV